MTNSHNSTPTRFIEANGVAYAYRRFGAATGTPQEVITGETLSRLYDTPIEVLTTSDGRLVVVGQPEAPAYHTDRHAH